MKILITKIRVDGGTQSRALIDPRMLQEYADDMQNGAQFPPITVFFDGKSYWCADGFHRVGAAKLLDEREIDADIKQGTVRDAILYSVGVNSSHGMRRTNEDKRRAVTRLLSDEEWVKWSDSEIARQCVVDHKTVAAVRSSLGKKHSEKSTEQRIYTTKHGTTSTMNTANIGRKSGPTIEPQPVETWTEPEPETHSEDAIRDIKNYVGSVLEEIAEMAEQHQVVNETLKWLRQLSVDFNRQSANV